MPDASRAIVPVTQDESVAALLKAGFHDLRTEVVMVREDGVIAGVQADGSVDILMNVVDAYRQLGIQMPAPIHIPSGAELPV